jgi:hypothetical protein
MSLEQWSAIAQILGAVVGIPSLIFVGIQLYLATNAVRAASSQAHSATYHELSASIVQDDNGFARIWQDGLGGTGELSESERVRFFAFVSSLLRFFESARIQWRRNQLYREHWRAIDQQARFLATQPGVREFWNERQHWHCLEFQGWFGSLMDQKRSDALRPEWVESRH